MRSTPLPLVYSCSGCSSNAQLANAFAVRLAREGLAEMSCVAGVGGGVAAILRRARAPRPRVTLDGCGLACARACLEREAIPVTVAVDLSRHDVRKRNDADFLPEDADRLWQSVIVPAIRVATLVPPVPFCDTPTPIGENHELES